MCFGVLVHTKSRIQNRIQNGENIVIRIARIDAIRLDLNTYNGNIYNEVGDKANMATTFDPDQLHY